jgi:hypothetical protein
MRAREVFPSESHQPVDERRQRRIEGEIHTQGGRRRIAARPLCGFLFGYLCYSNK